MFTVFNNGKIVKGIWPKPEPQHQFDPIERTGVYCVYPETVNALDDGVYISEIGGVNGKFWVEGGLLTEAVPTKADPTVGLRMDKVY